MAASPRAAPTEHRPAGSGPQQDGPGLGLESDPAKLLSPLQRVLQPQSRGAKPLGMKALAPGGVIIQVSGSNEIILSNEAAPTASPKPELSLLESSQPSGKLEGRGMEEGRG